MKRQRRAGGNILRMVWQRRIKRLLQSLTLARRAHHVHGAMHLLSQRTTKVADQTVDPPTAMRGRAGEPKQRCSRYGIGGRKRQCPSIAEYQLVELDRCRF